MCTHTAALPRSIPRLSSEVFYLTGESWDGSGEICGMSMRLVESNCRYDVMILCYFILNYVFLLCYAMVS